METFSDTLSYCSYISDEVQDEIRDNPMTCGCCVASEFMEENSTMITKELNEEVKSNPKQAFAAIRYALEAAKGTATAMDELLRTLVNLYPEEFPSITNQKGTDVSKISSAD